VSIRIKFIIALLATGFLSVALVGFVAHERLMSRFDDITRAHAAKNFRGDVASYWLTYGSWEEGLQAEPFRHFVTRRKALLGDAPRRAGPLDSGAPRAMDTGGATEATAIPPWRGKEEELATKAPGYGPPPPFRFVLFDPSGRILNPLEEIGRALHPEEWQHSVPIEVNGKIVAFASPMGIANYSETDRAYFAAVNDAMTWGVMTAALIATGLGFLLGNGLSRSLRQLTGAINRLDDGVLAQEVAIKTRDEVGTLAKAFNAMSSRLAASRAQLQEQNRTITQQAEQLREQAIRDSLTGLYNRRHFDERAKTLYEHAQRHDQPLAIVLGDIDTFKTINDDFSHATGDAVLREVAELLRQHTRSSDIVARYGGEEFVLALPESSLSEAVDCCERLRQSIATHDWAALHPTLSVTISLGVSCDHALGGIDAMLTDADQFLYQAKMRGRNRTCSSLDEEPTELRASA